ncbi:MAG TPA: glycerophosphodiester phosphodiesterase [Kineosporiaceae bacterium]
MADVGRRAGSWLRGVIAHRGTPRVFADNTVPGIAEAIRLGAAAVEVDVRTTRDGVPVLHHGPALRALRRPRRIADLSLAELRGRARHVPTLAEALAVAGGAGVPLVLDIGTVQTARACLAVLPPATGTAPSVWFCGAAGALAWVRAQDAGRPLMLSWDRRTPPPDTLLADIAPTMFNPVHRWLDAGTVTRWHERGVGVCAWTVDRSRRRGLLRRWGVDAVISNDVAGAVRDWRVPT